MSSSRIAIIAGTLAGLLGAALSIYYLSQGVQRLPAPPASRSAMGAPATSAPLAPAATTPAATPAALAERSTERTKEQASRALIALPELKAWSDRIRQHSGGKAHGALIEYDPAPRKVDGKRYWQLSFVENSFEAAELWESFLVSMTDDEILVEDPVSGQLLSLDRWRAQSHPMQRAGN